MKRAVVVGGGAGGAAAAEALQGRFQVTVLEEGRPFRPFRTDLGLPERLKRLGLLADARLIRGLFPAMHVRRGGDVPVLVSGHGDGGTTTLATGNAVRLDGALRRIGVDLDAEFQELERLVPTTTDHRHVWSAPSLRMFDACRVMGLDPRPLPKMGRQDRCKGCGHCVLGCPHGVKWDARQLLARARAAGAELRLRSRVRSIVIRGGAASGVVVGTGPGRSFVPADVVVVAAGGFGTPALLGRSGVPCRPQLFVDPVLCVATRWPGARQNSEMSMPFAVQREGFMLAPYFDQLSYFFDRRWRPAAGDIFGVMIKLQDSGTGTVEQRRIRAKLTSTDRERLAAGVDLVTELFARLAIERRDLFFGTVNAGHPGGTLPLAAREAASLHPPELPENVWVADGTLFPESPGGPPILTIMALARAVARRVVAAA